MSKKLVTSFDLGTKGEKLNGGSGLIFHDARSVDEKNGRFVTHSNNLIDRTLSKYNAVYVNDGQGGLRPAQSSQEIIDFIKKRVGERAPNARGVQTPLRKNQGEFFNATVQLGTEKDADGKPIDPNDVFAKPCKDLTDEERELVAEALMLQARVLIDKYGAENCASLSIHFDETHPHAHLKFVPIDKTGHLSYGRVVKQEKWGPMHTKWRAELQEKLDAAGIDRSVEMERVGLAGRGLDLPEFKAVMNEAQEHKATAAKAEKVARSRAGKAKHSLATAEMKEATAELSLIEAKSQAETIIDDAEIEAYEIRNSAHSDAAQIKADAERKAKAEIDAQMKAEKDRQAQATAEAEAARRAAQADRERARRVLDEAQAEAAEIKATAMTEAEATDEATKILEAAHSDADYLRSQAHSEAESIKSTASIEADDMKAQASTEARQTRDSADQYWRSTVADANATADEVRAHFTTLAEIINRDADLLREMYAESGRDDMSKIDSDYLDEMLAANPAQRAHHDAYVEARLRARRRTPEQIEDLVRRDAEDTGKLKRRKSTDFEFGG